MTNKEHDMIEKTLTVRNQLGLHARVATLVVQAMKQYACDVTLIKDEIEVNANSVLELLLLAATPGSEIVVRAKGPDSMDAINEIDRLIQEEDGEDT